MTVYEDIEKLTSNDFSEQIIDSFLQYEKKRIDVLLLKLEEILDSVTNYTIQLQQDEHMLFESRLKPVLAKISELAHSRKEMEKEELEYLCMELKSQCGTGPFLTYKLGGKCPPPPSPPLCPPTKSHFAPPGKVPFP